MLKRRIITAVILVAILLAVLFYLPPFVFFLVTVFVAFGCAWEWTTLMEVKKMSMRCIYLAIMSFAFLIMLFIPVIYIFFVTLFWWLFATLLIVLYPRASNGWGASSFWRGVMGLFVIVPCWVAINFIRNANDGDGIYALLFLFVLIWGADSAAYFVGRQWGKTKLAPRVSPGKSMQGLYGALVFTLIYSLLVLWLCHIPFKIWPWAVALSLITVLFSVCGDLFESMIKRKAGMKDSGNLLPGHGGLLDRIDSLTAAAPIFALGAMLLGMYLD